METDLWKLRVFLSQKVVRFKRSKICEEIQHIVLESKLVLNYEGGDITLQKSYHAGIPKSIY